MFKNKIKISNILNFKIERCLHSFVKIRSNNFFGLNHKINFKRLDFQIKSHFSIHSYNLTKSKGKIVIKNDKFLKLESNNSRLNLKNLIFNKLLFRLQNIKSQKQTKSKTLFYFIVFFGLYVTTGLIIMTFYPNLFGCILFRVFFLIDFIIYKLKIYKKNFLNSNKNECFDLNKTILVSKLNGLLFKHSGFQIKLLDDNSLPIILNGKIRFKKIMINFFDDNNDDLENKYKLETNVEALDINVSFINFFNREFFFTGIEIFGMNGKLILINNKKLEKKNHNNLKCILKNIKKKDMMLKNINYCSDQNEGHQSSIKTNLNFKNIKMHDTYIEIYINDDKSNNFLKLYIFYCDLPFIRGNRLLLDFLNLNNISGTINDSIFNLTKRQEVEINENNHSENKILRFKLNQIDFKSISNFGLFSKFNWINDGRIGIMADINFNNSYTKEVQNSLYESKSQKMISSFVNKLIQNQNQDISDLIKKNENYFFLLKNLFSNIYHTFTPLKKKETKIINLKKEYFVINIKITFFDLKVNMPDFLPLSFLKKKPLVSYSSLRSLIAFINNEHYQDPSQLNEMSLIKNNYSEPIVLKTTIIQKVPQLHEIENSYQSELVDNLLYCIYDDLINFVKVNEKKLFEKKTYLWSQSSLIQLLLLGIGSFL